MSKLNNLAITPGIVAGIGLAGDAYLQRDGRFDKKKDAIEYTTGILLLGGSAYLASRKDPSEDYRI